MAQKTDPGVKMGVFKDGKFSYAKVNVLEGHFEGQQFKFQGQIA